MNMNTPKFEAGDRVALTGTSGNAVGGPPHVYFEIWTKGHVGRFPDGRISPGEILEYSYDNMDNRLPFLECWVSRGTSCYQVPFPDP